ncbi:hypothetical protein O6A98_003812 [Escherichia coli]|nr:hypothetical protein [Escherichia coli]
MTVHHFTFHITDKSDASDIHKGYPAPYPIPEEHKACWMMQSLTAQPMTLTGHIRCADPDETGALT